MKVRFGRNDYLETKEIPEQFAMMNELFGMSPMGDLQSNEKLLLFTLLDQATKMSSEEDQATLARLTGSDRQGLIDEINNHISSIGI